MCLAADGAVRKAREVGIGLALVRRTTHTAAIGYYTRRVASMPAWPRSPPRPRSPTCPITARAWRRWRRARSRWRCRARRAPIVLDMATSVASLGRLGAVPPGGAGHCRRAGRSTPKATRPPMRPTPSCRCRLGGPKGAGLALMFELHRQHSDRQSDPCRAPSPKAAPRRCIARTASSSPSTSPASARPARSATASRGSLPC